MGQVFLRGRDDNVQWQYLLPCARSGAFSIHGTGDPAGRHMLHCWMDRPGIRKSSESCVVVVEERLSDGGREPSEWQGIASSGKIGEQMQRRSDVGVADVVLTSSLKPLAILLSCVIPSSR